MVWNCVFNQITKRQIYIHIYKLFSNCSDAEYDLRLKIKNKGRLAMTEVHLVYWRTEWSIDLNMDLF